MKTKMENVILGAVLALLLGTSLGFAQLPVVPGFSVEVYAELEMPTKLCFAPDGVMYVGNRNLASSANSAYRIEPGGGPGSISLYGPALIKAGAIGYDKDGLISGTPGTVLAAGGFGYTPHFTAIFPDETAQTLWQGPFINPGDIAFDSTGRMLFVDVTDRNVYQSSGGTPTVLLTVPLQDAHCMAIDWNDNIFISMGHFGNAKILAYDPQGKSIGSPILAGQVTTWSPFPIVFGKGGVWGYGLYVLVNHVLMRFDSPLESPGIFTTIGTEFSYGSYTDMEFGPDGCLYISSQSGHEILRIAPLDVIEAIQAQLWVFPIVIHRDMGDWEIMAMLRLPEGIKRSDIDLGQPLVLYPGEIEAIQQYAVQCGGRWRPRTTVFAFFDKAELMDSIPDDGPAELQVAGKLKTGQLFYGYDTVRIVSWHRWIPWWECFFDYDD
ncbi:MAG: hypothetical protein JXA81_10310 [Sedimentisphaerales bacterium]|nr:hypothetical protein [Sedimentisphaerales bacterium]